MIRRAVGLLCAAIVLAACGGGDGGRFDDQVAAVRQAVEASDRDAALAGLDDIALLALDGRQQGELTEAEVAEVAALVEQGRALVDEQLPAPSPPSPPPAPPVVAESPDDGGDDEEHDDEGEDREGEDRKGGGRDDSDDRGGKRGKGKGDKGEKGDN